MKKLLLIALVLSNFMFVNAQNYDTLNIQGMANFARYDYCANEYAGVVVFGEPNWNCEWIVNGETLHADHIELLNNEPSYVVQYMAGVNRTFYVHFHPSSIQNPFPEPLVWKGQYESITLSIPYEYEDEYEWQWFNGSNDYGIDVTDDGVYSVTFTSLYGCELEQNTFSVEVRNNVEAEYATTDLDQNRYMVVWTVYAEQAQYVSSVDVYCDNEIITRVPYLDGSYVDAGHSVNTARTYTLMAIDNNGNECGIMSNPKKSMHMAKSIGMGELNLAWNYPEGVVVNKFIIYELSPNGEWIRKDDTQELTYSCPESDFNYGYVFVYAELASKDGYSLVSNRSDDIVGVDESNSPSSGFGVYPNPSNGAFIVEGPQNVTIYNMMGQVIATSYAENGVHTISLSSAGVYFVKSDEGTTQKVVIE